MTVKDFLDHMWWTTEIAVVDNNLPAGNDFTKELIKREALYYGRSDYLYEDDDNEVNQYKVESYGVKGKRLVIRVQIKA